MPVAGVKATFEMIVPSYCMSAMPFPTQSLYGGIKAVSCLEYELLFSNICIGLYFGLQGTSLTCFLVSN